MFRTLVGPEILGWVEQ